MAAAKEALIAVAAAPMQSPPGIITLG